MADKAETGKAPWITYRPELKVMDCTVRDGGLINDHQFTDDFVRAVYETCLAAGIDYMEIGYRNSPRLFPKDKYGTFRHSSEEDIRRVVGDHDSKATRMKLAVMADAGKSDWQEIGPQSESVLDMIRVACYVHQISEAAEMIAHCHEQGYETTCNIMAISAEQEVEIAQALEIAGQTPCEAIVVVDSFGNLYREQVDILVTQYKAVADATGKDVGIHAHNNMQLAFANTIEAIILGANRIDATIAGMGRGAGNCPMELLLGFLRNPRYRQRPVIALLQQHFIEMKKSIEWGPLLPYNLTGQMNRHPRAAIEWRAGDRKDDFVGFYDKLVTDI